MDPTASRQEKLERGTKRQRDDSTTPSRPTNLPETHSRTKRQALNSRHPETVPLTFVPSYAAPSPGATDGSGMPPLPPIIESLSEAPFTHPGTVNAKYSADSVLSYDRLEFLGDAYIEVIATRLIYSRFPRLLVGKQSKLREQLVQNKTLATFAQKYGFEDRIQSNAQELYGKTWEKCLADTFEAYVAAVVLSSPDSGFADAERWLTELWADILLQDDVDRNSVEKNSKEDLYRLITGKGVKIEYLDERPMEYADKGRQRHSIGVFLTGWGYEKKRLGGAIGVGKKEAGMLAAQDALDNNRPYLDEIVGRKSKQDAARKAVQGSREPASTNNGS